MLDLNSGWEKWGETFGVDEGRYAEETRTYIAA